MSIRLVIVMATAWVILECRYGTSVRNPTAPELAAAIAELYHEDLPGMTQADYEEHGAASLRYGFDDGPMFVISVTRGGVVTFEEWADQDYEQELHPPRVSKSFSEQQALELWKCLGRGEIDVVRVLMEMGPGRLMA